MCMVCGCVFLVQLMSMVDLYWTKSEHALGLMDSILASADAADMSAHIPLIICKIEVVFPSFPLTLSLSLSLSLCVCIEVLCLNLLLHHAVLYLALGGSPFRAHHFFPTSHVGGGGGGVSFVFL